MAVAARLGLSFIIVPTIASVDHVAGCTKIPPLTGFCYLNIILSIHTGPQQPFIGGAMRFVAVQAGKDIVCGLISRERVFKVAPATRAVGLLSMNTPVSGLICRSSPVNGSKGGVAFGTVDIIP
jgi:hypothetical protein